MFITVSVNAYFESIVIVNSILLFKSEFSCVVEKKERRKNGSKNSTSDY